MSGRRGQPTPIRFGTDGWRAVIADGFTFENVERVAQAYADFVNRQPPQDEAESSGPKKVVVGYDRRFLSEHFAARASRPRAGGIRRRRTRARDAR